MLYVCLRRRHVIYDACYIAISAKQGTQEPRVHDAATHSAHMGWARTTSRKLRHVCISSCPAVAAAMRSLTKRCLFWCGNMKFEVRVESGKGGGKEARSSG